MLGRHFERIRRVRDCATRQHSKWTRYSSRAILRGMIQSPPSVRPKRELPFPKPTFQKPYLVRRNFRARTHLLINVGVKTLRAPLQWWHNWMNVSKLKEHNLVLNGTLRAFLPTIPPVNPRRARLLSRQLARFLSRACNRVKMWCKCQAYHP